MKAALAALFVASLAVGGSALAAERALPAGLCVDISVPKGSIAAHDGKWTELTPEQWQFLRGIYAMDPETPPGLPYGDKAVLAKVEGNDGGLIFFIDGDKACTPMRAPPKLLEMMDDVAAGKIDHEGDGL
jgi:hypothetical protein